MVRDPPTAHPPCRVAVSIEPRSKYRMTGTPGDDEGAAGAAGVQRDKTFWSPTVRLCNLGQITNRCCLEILDGFRLSTPNLKF